MEDPRLPLKGIHVVELGSSVAVPYGTWILATLGASVLKVERPDTGDDCRHWGVGRYHGMSAFFVALNAGKHSVAVDIKDPDQLATLRRHIVEKADIVVQNMRPGGADALGLGADALMAENPRLIYCNSGAFGAKGPLDRTPGYDPLMQAFGGIMSVTGEDGRPPVRVGVSIVDMGTGMWCALGAITALYRRRETGRGCRIDASLFETTLGWMNYHATNWFGAGVIGERVGSSGPGIAPYQAFECADGYLVVAAPNDRMFAKLSQVLGHPEWPEDPRFVVNRDRFANRHVLTELIESESIKLTRRQLQDKLDAVGVPSAPLQDISEVANHPQTAALDIVQTTDDGRFKLMGLPLSFDGWRPPQHEGAPELGQHQGDLFEGVDPRHAGRR